MNWTLQKKVALGFLGVLAVLFLIQYATYRGMMDFIDSARNVEHTQQVLEKINALRVSLKDAESDQRGFIITGQPDYLNRFYEAQRNIREEYQELRLLVGDNPQQIKLLDQLFPVIRKRIELLDRAITLRQNQGLPAALKFIGTGQSKAAMDEAYALFEELKADERRQLHLRNAMVDAKAQQTFMLFIAGAFLVIFIFLVLQSIVRREIGERQKKEEELRKSEERYQLAALGTNDGLWDWEVDSDRIYLSPRWKSILGYLDDEMKNYTYEWFSRIHPDDVDAVTRKLDAIKAGDEIILEAEYRLKHKDGSYRWVLNRGIAAVNDDGTASRIAGSLSDITFRKLEEQKLFYKATHDTLTGLYNREQLMSQLTQAMSAAKRHKFPLSLTIADLDKFKQINDTYGHLLGDKVLLTFSKIIREGTRTEDLAARFGGDEFCLVFPHTPAEKVKTLLDRIRRKLEDTVFETASGETCSLTATFGVCQLTPDILTPTEFFEKADQALYMGKRERNTVWIYDEMFLKDVHPEEIKQHQTQRREARDD